MVDPVRRGAAGQTVVEAFYHPVRLQVVGGGLVVLNVKKAAEGGPQGGGELGPAVGCDDCWDPIAAHPSLKQCIGAVYCCGGI